MRILTLSGMKPEEAAIALQELEISQRVASLPTFMPRSRPLRILGLSARLPSEPDLHLPRNSSRFLAGCVSARR